MVQYCTNTNFKSLSTDHIGELLNSIYRDPGIIGTPSVSLLTKQQFGGECKSDETPPKGMAAR